MGVTSRSFCGARLFCHHNLGWVIGLCGRLSLGRRLRTDRLCRLRQGRGLLALQWRILRRCQRVRHVIVHVEGQYEAGQRESSDVHPIDARRMLYSDLARSHHRGVRVVGAPDAEGEYRDQRRRQDVGDGRGDGRRLAKQGDLEYQSQPTHQARDANGETLLRRQNAQLLAESVKISVCDRPDHEDGASHELDPVCKGHPGEPEIHVAHGDAQHHLLHG
mmetsp:Transcript_31868/g.78660  ORF Transcript_31868/g.78660 Transcript_31868/m.78660 type:complete len:219 (-) Transcript_31868:2201-2857(-)